MRPFGISVLYMGWDEEYGFQLYMSDPSGNYGGWKGTCIGNNSQVWTYTVYTINIILKFGMNNLLVVTITSCRTS